MTPAAFWKRTEALPSGCIEWRGHIGSEGYGQTAGKMAHRLAYEFAHRHPGALFVLHRCDNRKCVNPEHLWLGTQSDNIRDCVAKGRHRGASKTHCAYGHPFDEGNTRVSGNKRTCRKCDARRQAECKARKRAA